MNSHPRHFVIALPCAIALISGLYLALTQQTTALPRMFPRKALSHTQSTQTHAKALTFADRVAYQHAIEEVYWRHRIWPKQNSGAKPSLEQVMPQAQIENKVENYLRDSAALEIYWHKPITPEQLQAEMERMAHHTKQPEILREVFAALGNDPTVIAECLARTALAERLARNLYAHDERFHGELKRRAEADLKAHRTAEEMKDFGAQYSEAEWRRLDPTDVDLARDDVKATGAMNMSESEWIENVQKLAPTFDKPDANTTDPYPNIPVGKLSRLQENEHGYYATAVIRKRKDQLRLATVEWKKEPFDTWRSKVGRHMPVTMIAPVTADYSLPAIAGAPSDCTDDSWMPTLAATQPAARQLHTAVWTGSEMIIWGGSDLPPSNQFKFFRTGSRYNPATDTWSEIVGSIPVTERDSHTAVWTGTEMIVWGGRDRNFNYLNSGARYNPTTNSWIPTNFANAPTARAVHTAVWTGSEMIIWGGFNGFGAFNTGARYNPNTDGWIATTSTGSPTARFAHTAIWTGSEMIVWGGFGSTYVNTGARYNPSTDNWTPTSVAAAPAARYSHTAVWTGSQMIVWGGYNTNAVNTGGQYDPSSDSWVTTTTTNAPSARYLHTAVWTGSEMIIWGGSDHVTDLGTGARYDPTSDSWTTTSPTNAPDARESHTAIWTGTEMIVWGGGLSHSSPFDSGGRYDPTTDSWTATNRVSAPTAHYFNTAVWTGSEMIIWGGVDNSSNYLDTGARYNPSTDTWTFTSTTTGTFARSNHTAVWTGTEMIIWGGVVNYSPAPYTNSGAKYNPATDSWVLTNASVYTPAGRADHTAVWTGSEMIVWGGYSSTGGYLNTGGRYNPNTDTWVGVSATSAPSARTLHTAVWTGNQMIVWGGYSGLNTGGKYNPATDTWIAVSTTNAPAGRYHHSAIWTGCEMIIWGGLGLGGYRNNGGRYDPSSDSWLDISTSDAPDARSGHTAVWTGSLGQMIVWGGIGLNGYLNTGGKYCAFVGPAPCSPTPTPTPSPTPSPTPTPRPSPTPTPTPSPVRVAVSAAPTQINEGQSATYTVTASSPVTRSIVVHYAMSGTATNGSDYLLTGTAGQVAIPSGQSSGTVTLKSKADHVTEGTETAIMTLQPGSGYRLGNPKQATVSILDSP